MTHHSNETWEKRSNRELTRKKFPMSTTCPYEGKEEKEMDRAILILPSAVQRVGLSEYVSTLILYFYFSLGFLACLFYLFSVLSWLTVT